MALSAFGQTASDIVLGIKEKKFSVSDVCEFYIDRTEKHRTRLNTHLYFDADWVRKQAAAQNARMSAGEDLPLAGLPILIKDNICVEGRPTTCASKILQGYKPPYNATVVQRLVQAGAVLFGKANCDEFAMGSSNENSAYGPVRNPWNEAYVPGGSSGGSAAAVAADLVPAALGSDTGGSIRQPASLCGIVGLKTTYGRVSRYGLVAYGSSLDQIGPMTRTVEDSAMIFDAISGHDAKDSTSTSSGPSSIVKLLKDFSKEAKKPLTGVKIGLVKEFYDEGLQDDVRRQCKDEAVKVLETLGAKIMEVSLPNVKYSVSTYYIVATAEASANLARFDGVKYGYRYEEAGKELSLKDLYRKTRSHGFGREVKQRIMLGTYVLSSGYYDAYYAKANRARHLMAEDFRGAFSQCDVLISPTSPTTAFKLGEKSSDPLAMYLSDICTIAINLARIPAVSIPCGFSQAGLPIGLQMMAPEMGEEALLKGAYAFECATQWYKAKTPNV